MAGSPASTSRTSIDITKDKTHFTCDAYFNAELENAAYAKKVFKNSAVVQYINFWPCGWADESGYTKRSFEFAKKHGVGIGGPDILPYNKPHMNNAYRFLNENRGKLDLVAMAVQEPDFEYDSPVTGKPYTRQEFVELDNSRLALAAMATMVPGPQIAAGPRTPEPAQKSADRPSS